MKTKPLISVVVNTYNEAGGLARCLKSVEKLADEIVVVDMQSTDDSVKIAKTFGAEVFSHEKMDYVEPARNFAISKATGKWILILDPDEKISFGLARNLKFIAEKKDNEVDYVLVPRKNIIFGKWMENTRWWPDYIPRFFKKGKVSWPKQIHRQPELKGNIYTLPDDKNSAIVHYHYDSLDQFLSRAMRYSEVQAEELIKEKKYKLSSSDLVLKPAGEFYSRFFVGEGYRDGFHGLALAVLQSYATALVYLKVWEKRKYEKRVLEPKKLKSTFSKLVYETDYWQSKWWLDRTQGYQKLLLSWFYRIRGLILKLF
jgi:(heptosyl)LPS beta-1,4-glucosyltransferase